MDTEVSSQRRELNLLQNTELLARAGDTGVLQRKLQNNLKAVCQVHASDLKTCKIIFVNPLEVMIGKVRAHFSLYVVSKSSLLENSSCCLPVSV